MPNWCSASYAIEGDAEEVKKPLQVDEKVTRTERTVCS